MNQPDHTIRDMLISLTGKIGFWCSFSPYSTGFDVTQGHDIRRVKPYFVVGIDGLQVGVNLVDASLECTPGRPVYSLLTVSLEEPGSIEKLEAFFKQLKGQPCQV
jgi:hypothetical protein